MARARLAPSQRVQRVLGSAGTAPSRKHDTLFGRLTVGAWPPGPIDVLRRRESDRRFRLIGACHRSEPR